MKYIFTLLALLFGTIYGLLFTSFGNDFFKPILEKQIQKQTQLNSELKIFKLSFSNLHVKLNITPKNTIDINGSFSLISQNFNISYNLVFNNLKALKPITNINLNGKLQTNGKVVGNFKNFNVIGKSSLANSTTNYKTNIVNLYPSLVLLETKNLDLENLLFMINQKKYASAKINLDMNITNLKTNNLDGKISLYTKNGKFNKKLILNDYNISLPYSNFKFTTNTKLVDNKALTSLNFKTKIMNLHVKEAKLNLASQKLESDYKVTIPNLNNLFFVTKTKLKGSFTANGKIIKDENLFVTFYSNTCGGKIITKIKNENLTTTIKGLDTIKLLDMLMYPKIFKSTLDAKLNYNLINKKGILNGDLKNGKFQKNTILDLVKQYARTNLYIENFNGKIKAKITKNNILTSIALKSNNSSISSKNAKINLKERKVNASVNVIANKNPISFKINGDINKPKIKVDANKIIEKESKKVIGNFINNLF